MNSFLRKLKIIWKDRSLRGKIFVVLGLLVVFRLMAAIPVPGIDSSRLAAFLTDNQFFGILNIFAGGGLSNLSIMMLGVGPYITATIILQVLSIMVPRLKALQQEEGEAGRRKFSQYSRMLTVPLAVLQAFSLLTILNRQGILGELTPQILITALIVATAGSMFLMWIGEMMTEYGISNGVSIIIFAGIVASLPQQVGQLLVTFDVSQLPTLVIFGVLALVLVVAVVYMNEAERPVPVTYARQVRGGNQSGGVSSYIPLRVNQAGVMPIIFALSILLVPQLLSGLFALSDHSIMQSIARALTLFSQTTWLYSIVYFFFVIIFTYFYTAVTFDPHAMAENLQKSGAFIPGIRPGAATEEYVGKIMSRITLAGAVFLGLIAIIPLIVREVTGISAVAIGGTALLIVVAVVLDVIKKVDSQVSMHEY